MSKIAEALKIESKVVMPRGSHKSTERRLEELDEKVDILIDEARLVMSPMVIIVLIVIAVIGGIWSEMLLKRYRLLEREGHGTLLLFSIIAIVVIVLLARHVNTVPK